MRSASRRPAAIATGVRLHPAGDIADRIRARNVGLLVFVGAHEAVRITRDVQQVQAEVSHGRQATDRPQHAIERPQPPSVGQLQCQLSGRVPVHCRRRGLGDDLDAVGVHQVAQVYAKEGFKGSEQLIAAQHDAQARPQRREHAGQFHGHVTAADDSDTGRSFRQLEKAVGSDAVGGAGNGRHHRVAAGGEHDPRGAVHVAGRDDTVVRRRAWPGRAAVSRRGARGWRHRYR